MDERQELEDLRRLDELERKARGETPGKSVYTAPVPSAIAEGAKWALGRVGEASQFVDKYTGGPIRAAIGALQEGRSLSEPYIYEETPSWKDIVAKAGVSDKPTIKSPLIMNPFDPEANKLSPAGIVGGVVGTVADPLTYLNMKYLSSGLGAGAEMLKEGLTPAAKALAKPLKNYAEERALKAAVGGGKTPLMREFSGITTQGGLNPEAAAASRRAVGRKLLDTGMVGPLSSTEDVGKKAATLLGKLQTEGFEQFGEVVDQFNPQGAVDLSKAADRIEEYANSLKPTSKNVAIAERLNKEAEILRSQGKVSFKDAQDWKNQYKHSKLAPDPMESDKSAMNLVKQSISDEMENAIDQTGVELSKIPGFEDASDLIKKYKTTKEEYGPIRKITQASTLKDVSEKALRQQSPSDYAAIAAGLLGGGIIGGDIRSAAIGAGLGLGHKVVRERGAAFAAKSADLLRKLIESAPESLTKYQNVLSKAAVAGNEALLMTHQTLMNNDKDYRQAVIQGLTNVQTEPFNTIGKVLDASGLANLGMAGIVIPMSLKKGDNILRAVFDMIKHNVGEDPAEVKRAFLSAVKEKFPDKNIKALEDFFDNSYWAANAGKNKDYAKFYDDYRRIKAGTPNQDDLLIKEFRDQYNLNKPINKDDFTGIDRSYLKSKIPSKDLSERLVRNEPVKVFSDEDIYKYPLSELKKKTKQIGVGWSVNINGKEYEIIAHRGNDVVLKKMATWEDLRKKGIIKDDNEFLHQEKVVPIHKKDENLIQLQAKKEESPFGKVKDEKYVQHVFDREFGESDTMNRMINEGNREAQSEGNFGVTIAEYIEAQKDFLENELKASDDVKDILRKELDDTWEWHKKNGSLDDEI